MQQIAFIIISYSRTVFRCNITLKSTFREFSQIWLKKRISGTPWRPLRSPLAKHQHVAFSGSQLV